MPKRRVLGFRPSRLVVLVLVVGMGILFVAWLSWTGLRLAAAKDHLDTARARLAALQQHLLDGDTVAAQDDVSAIRAATRDARSDTDSIAVRAAARVPYLGRTAHAGRSLTDIADGLAGGPLPRLVDAGLALSAERLRVGGDTVDVAGLAAAAPPLDAAMSELAAFDARLRSVSQGTLVLDPVDHARAALTASVAAVENTGLVAQRGARIGPAMLGANGLRRYLVADVNVNEARGTGGVIGGYHLLEADKGRLRVVESGPASALRPATAWRDANRTVDFATAASAWAALWERSHAGKPRQHIDGVLSLSPPALAQILNATKPVQTPQGGAPLSAGNLIARVTDRYAEIKQAKTRDEVLAEVTSRVLTFVLDGAGESRALLTRLGRAAGNGQLLLWSARPDEQDVLAQAPIAGTSTLTRQPYAAVVVNNVGGTKLDTYLSRSVTYFADPCTGARRSSTVIVRLGSVAPDKVPAYLAQRTDHPAPGTPPGQARYAVSVYTTVGATLSSATLDADPVALRAGDEAGRPVFTAEVTLDRNATRVLVLHLAEPVTAGSALVPVQPLLRPQVSAVDVPACGR